MCHVDGQGCEAWNVEAGGHGRMEAGTIARLQCGASGALLREGWSFAKGSVESTHNGPYESSQQSYV